VEGAVDQRALILYAFIAGDDEVQRAIFLDGSSIALYTLN